MTKITNQSSKQEAIRLVDPMPVDPSQRTRTPRQRLERCLWRIRRWCRSTALRAAYLMAPEPPWLYIHTHMRAGSTLLTEIILDHPTCYGFGETQIAHDSRRHVLEAAAAIHQKLNRIQPITRGLFVDKIVKPIRDANAPEVIARYARYSIFLTREPDASVASIIRLLDCPQSVAEKYLINRLNSLAGLARDLADRVPMIYITYEDMIQRTEHTLALLSQALSLDPPLTEAYTPSPSVGQPNTGDPSEYIHAGHIVRDRPRYLPPHQLSSQTLVAYLRCVDTLSSCCHTLPRDTGGR